MGIFKNKLFILLIVLLVIVFVGVCARGTHKEITQTKFIAWVTEGYSQQFCRVIYPRVANCVTFQHKDCIEIASDQINSCVESKKSSLPGTLSDVDAQKTYSTFADCFEKNMHKKIVQDYLIKTPECEHRLS